MEIYFGLENVDWWRRMIKWSVSKLKKAENLLREDSRKCLGTPEQQMSCSGNFLLLYFEAVFPWWTSSLLTWWQLSATNRFDALSFFLSFFQSWRIASRKRKPKIKDSSLQARGKCQIAYQSKLSDEKQSPDNEIFCFLLINYFIFVISFFFCNNLLFRYKIH